jgi:hypothetical protein
MGLFDGVAKTMLEFRFYSKTELEESGLRLGVFGSSINRNPQLDIEWFSDEVNVVEDNSEDT